MLALECATSALARRARHLLAPSLPEAPLAYIPWLGSKGHPLFSHAQQRFHRSPKWSCGSATSSSSRPSMTSSHAKGLRHRVGRAPEGRKCGKEPEFTNYHLAG